MSKKVNDMGQEMVNSFKAMNELALANSEKLVAMNIAQWQKQADVTLAAMRSAMELKDFNDVQAYMTQQGEVAKEVLEGVVADAQTVAKIGEEAAAEFTKLVNANVAAAKKAA